MEKKHVEKESEMSSEAETLKESNENIAEEQSGNPTDTTTQDDSVGDDKESERDELSEMKDKYLRLYSEFDNFRRRTAKERLDILNTAHSDLMGALLPVLDDFDRAKKTLDKKDIDTKSFIEGVGLIHDKFRKVLEQKGLKEMECAEGGDFDPEFHEAISQIPVEKEKLKGKIVDVVEKGYLMGEKVIRYAKIVIGG